MRKPFNRNLWKKYDALGKKWVAQIAPEGYTVKENINRTGVDLLVYHKGKIVAYIEPEVKAVWKGKFQWDTIHLPGRKIKYCGLKYRTLFVLFRSDGKQYYCFWDRLILRSSLIEVPNKYVPKNEEFYDIKLNRRGVYTNIKEAFEELGA